MLWDNHSIHDSHILYGSRVFLQGRSLLFCERTNLSQYDKEALESINMSANKIGKAIESFKLREGLNEMMNLAKKSFLLVKASSN